MTGFQKLTFTYEALQMWLNALQIEARATKIPLNEAYSRVCAEDIVAKNDLPRFNRSAVDGFAVKAEETTGTTQSKPLLFRLTEEEELADAGPREAKQIWTGNPIPKGADAVVMLENTKRTNDKIEIWSQAIPYENISRKGEDIKKGEIAVKGGTRLRPQHIGLIAALGYDEIRAVQKPRIAILATGNELAEVGTQLKGNQIHESNRVMLSALCQELDAEPLDLGIAKDETTDIMEKIQIGLKIADAVITTGGTSVGGLDLVPEVVNMIGKPGVVVHGMAIRPGMPTALAVLEGKPVIILSGNPVAAIVGFEVFGRTIVCKMLGMKKEEARPTVEATMARKVTAALGRKTFVRVKIVEKNGELFAEPISTRGSGALSTMTRSNGYVIVPENREGVAENEKVTVHIFASIEA
jgi:molybdopterin molybdotransferase